MRASVPMRVMLPSGPGIVHDGGETNESSVDVVPSHKSSSSRLSDVSEGSEVSSSKSSSNVDKTACPAPPALGVGGAPSNELLLSSGLMRPTAKGDHVTTRRCEGQQVKS